MHRPGIDCDDHIGAAAEQRFQQSAAGSDEFRQQTERRRDSDHPEAAGLFHNLHACVAQVLAAGSPERGFGSEAQNLSGELAADAISRCLRRYNGDLHAISGGGSPAAPATPRSFA